MKCTLVHQHHHRRLHLLPRDAKPLQDKKRFLTSSKHKPGDGGTIIQSKRNGVAFLVKLKFKNVFPTRNTLFIFWVSHVFRLFGCGSAVRLTGEKETFGCSFLRETEINAACPFSCLVVHKGAARMSGSVMYTCL